MNADIAMITDAQARLAGVALPPGAEPFAGVFAHAPHLVSREAKYRRKRCANLEDAVRRSGLKSGMTVSFHHAFREGDKTINTVVACLASMGFRDLTLAASSLLSCNTPLIEHIRSGVIRRIYTSGMRGKLAEAISNGLMDEPINIPSHGGRVNLMDRGEGMCGMLECGREFVCRICRGSVSWCNEVLRFFHVHPICFNFPFFLQKNNSHLHESPVHT